MATPKGSNDVKIWFDNSAGTLVDISQYVTEFGGVQITAMTEQTSTFGDTWVENTYVGMKELGDLTIKGFYDETASTGINAVINNSGTPGVGETRTFIICYNASTGTTNNYRVSYLETIITGYNRLPEVGGLTKFELTLKPASSMTDTITGSDTKAGQ